MHEERNGDALSLLADMLAIPSPSGEEGAIGSFLASRMREMGFVVYRDRAGNVVGEVGSRYGPTVLLISHMDTAGRDLPFRREDGRLFGRGAVDAKGPLAAMIAAASRCGDATFRIVVAAVVEEERPGSAGAVELARTMSPPWGAIVGEPGGASSVVLGYKGQLVLEYEVVCPPSHPTSSSPKASEIASEFWSRLIRLHPSGGGFDDLVPTLLDFRGDAVHAKLRIDCRIPRGFDDVAFLAALGRAPVNGRTRILGSVPAVLVSRTNPLARALRASIRSCGGSPKHKVKLATSDMNVLAQQWSVPMVTYGPGDGHLDHSDSESIECAEFLLGVGVLETCLRTLGAELRGDGPGGNARIIEAQGIDIVEPASVNSPYYPT